MTDAVVAPLPPVLRAFGDYGLLRLLGRSSLTIAWLAVEQSTGVVVRLLASTQPIGDPQARNRCVEEAQQQERESTTAGTESLSEGGKRWQRLLVL